jgi:truncated hemoglobin YjbI
MRAHFLFLGVGVGVLFGQSPNAASPDFFETKIRPILVNNCYSCHTDSQLGGLRLDSAEAMLKGGMHGAAIVPGDPDKSLLITAVRQTREDLKMPLGGKLTDAEVADLTAWVKAGAPWPKAAAAVQNGGPAPSKYTISPQRKKFWSFLPLSAPAVPAVKDTKWPKTNIDRFVLANLEKQGLKPVAPASKHDLIRRASLDLTGLPPTPEEVAAFEKDNSPDAFAKVVDRLLASPHYGERWGRIWLDVARYGEDDYRSLNPNPKGYRPYPNAYAYRDWVIQAFNDDLPYDQFVKAQLAGDLMPENVRYKMLPATGFLGLGPWYYDNGSNEVTRADERHDRVDAVTRGFLGLTVACARCHDHKYDPIPQTDYYALAGVFFNTIYEEYPLAPKKVVDEYTKLEDELDMKQKILQEEQQNLTNELSRSLAYQISNYLQGVYEVTGARQKREVAQVVEQRKLDYELLDRWIKYMAKPTDKYHNKDAWQAMIKKGGTPAEAKRLADEFQQEAVEAMLAKADIDAQNKVIADKDIDGTKPKKRTDKPSNFVSNKDFNPGSWLRLLSLPEQQNNFYTEIFQRELKDSDDPNAMMAAGARQGNPGVLMFRGWGLQTRLGPADQARLKTMQDDVSAARKKLEPHYPFLHGVKDSEKPVNIQLAIRGNPENLGAEVPRHFLSVFAEGDPKPFTKGSGRMELAEDIVQQPVAMRVIVNRIWKSHFDTGIVDTPSNFGQMGERPTNPELLEYLTSTFVKNGMSIKKLTREIMLSSVYQLSTQNDEANFAKDSGNRMYWRFNRRRMDAEELRDSVLSVSGNLDDALGGPSQDLTPANQRRTVYGKVSRYKLDTYLQTFDFPPPNITAEKRFTTTVPLQRLFLMNSDFMQIEAEDLAKRVAAEPDNRARIRKIYQLVYARDPSEQEMKLGLDYLHTEPLKEYEENKNKPPERAAGGGRGRRGGGGGNSGGGKGVPPASEGGAKPDAAKPDPTPAKPDPTNAKPDPTNAKPDATVISKVEASPAPATGPAAEGGTGAAPETFVAPDAAGGGGTEGAGAQENAAQEDATPENAEADNAGMGMGMFGGVPGMGGRRGNGPPAAPQIKYEPTAWGRYAKILLSSTEFFFIN